MGSSPVSVADIAPVPVPLGTFNAVGFADVPYAIPFSVTVSPPSAVTLPATTALTAVIAVAGLVVVTPVAAVSTVAVIARLPVVSALFTASRSAATVTVRVDISESKSVPSYASTISTVVSLVRVALATDKPAGLLLSVNLFVSSAPFEPVKASPDTVSSIVLPSRFSSFMSVSGVPETLISGFSPGPEMQKSTGPVAIKSPIQRYKVLSFSRAVVNEKFFPDSPTSAVDQASEAGSSEK